MSYHLTEIPKGELGQVSKIMEEVLELEDAMEQGARIMALCELSDIVGAVQAFLDMHFPETSMDDLVKMSKLTQRAFASGSRS